MKLTVIILILYLYLRRSLHSVFQLRKIEKVLDLYNAFMKSKENDKNRLFNEIARKRPLINELLNSYYVWALSYDDFYNGERFKQTYMALLEKMDEHEHNIFKFLHPKYLLKDVFFLPSSVFGFLLNRDFNKSSFFVSFCTWIATVLISAYASEIRLMIDSLIKKIIETI